MGANDRDDEANKFLAPVAAIGSDDVDRQGEEEMACPEQGIGEGQIIALSRRQQDVDFVAEGGAVERRGEGPVCVRITLCSRR
jgi:hypothetical protein